MSFIKVKCQKCQKVHLINQEEFEFEQVDSDERQMGAEITYEGELEIECECGQTITVKHRYWEYPVGSPPNHRETEVEGADVVENKL